MFPVYQKLQERLMKEQIDRLRSALEKAKQDVGRYDRAIRALQEVCEHDWHYDGHGHNYDVYVCGICGMSEER